jgi:tetratricopeptide (TPR) repeat protein
MAALEIAKSYNEILDLAKEAELASDVEKATKYYEKATRLEPLEPFSYNRLMIIYRKEKNYTAELNTINRGIEKFLQDKKNREEEFNTKHKQAARLSKSLIKVLQSPGSTDLDIGFPEPVNTWQKRKLIVEQKLTKKPPTGKKRKK